MSAPLEEAEAGGVAPRVTYSADFGQQSDSVADVAVDGAGNLWLVGGTTTDFPITADAADRVRAPYEEGFVARLDADGVLAYATYLGGSRGGNAFNCIGGVAIDDDGNVYVAGTTESTDFPVVGDVVQGTAPGGAGDGFLAKFDRAGRLLRATYFGGSGFESCPGRGYPVASIALGPGGALYALIGSTSSTEFPAAGAVRARRDADGLVARFDRDLQPVWGRFVGGTYSDQMTRVAADAEGNVYVTGTTMHVFGGAHDFPTTPGALQASTETGSAPVLVKYTPAGEVAYATFLTATRGDSSPLGYPNLAVAPDGTAYVAMLTGSADMPATPGAFRASRPGATDVFVFAVQPDGRTLRYGTYVGGRDTEEASLAIPALALTAAGQLALGFRTFSTDLPLRAAFVTEPTSSAIVMLDADGGDLVYASYLRHVANALTHRAGALYVGGGSFPPYNGIGAQRITEAPAPCRGDCDGDGTVRVNELISGVRIALGELASEACAALDGDGDGSVSIAELVDAVGALLTGCG